MEKAGYQRQDSRLGLRQKVRNFLSSLAVDSVSEKKIPIVKLKAHELKTYNHPKEINSTSKSFCGDGGITFSSSFDSGPVVIWRTRGSECSF